MLFSHSGMERSVTCRVDTSPSEGQRGAGLVAQVCWGTAGLPRHSTHREARRDAAFRAPECIRWGDRYHPRGTPRLWGINLIPVHTNRQSQAPLGETDTVPIGRSWKRPLRSSPQRQFDSLNMPQTDCPCQLPLVQYVAQLWLLNQSTARRTARGFCCSADFKYGEQSL